MASINTLISSFRIIEDSEKNDNIKNEVITIEEAIIVYGNNNHKDFTNKSSVWWNWNCIYINI